MSDYKYWVDKNGTQWEIGKMTTHQLKKAISQCQAKFDEISSKQVKKGDNKDMNLAVMAYCYASMVAFEEELKRRKQK